ncbi:hypothetical protein [Aeromonas sobria]|uniref:hypothetical protein n=1 Tax=Aeromonas sobria TaxID=646 RepID=UPI003F2CD8CE
MTSLNINYILNQKTEQKITIDDVSYLIRKIDNDDYFIFFEINEGCSLDIFFDVSFLSNIRLDNKYVEPPFDVRYGNNKLTGWQSYVKSSCYEFVTSKRYAYKIATNEQSKVYELCSELDVLINERQISIPESECKQSFTLIISKSTLFSDEHILDKYLELFYSELSHNNAVCSTWYLYNGLYTKLPESIIPYTKNGYQVSIHHSSKKELIPLYRNTDCRFIYNLLYNAAFTVLSYQPQFMGLFLTTYTSAWLHRRYALSAPYIDTRLNETFTNALNDIKEITPSFDNFDISLNYANFLISQIDSKCVYRSNKGIFFPDYFDTSMNNKTHTSLNHQLGIANYLLECYKKTNKSEYADVYHRILEFIIETSDKWLTPEGDLYYELLEDSSGFIFSGKDYTYVTLNDILIVIDKHKEFYGETIPKLEILAQSKMRFLDNSGYGLFNPDSKIPSGEGILDKEKSKKLVLKLGLDGACKRYLNYIDSNNLYSYTFNRSISEQVLNAVHSIQLISTKNSIAFNDPGIKHWEYNLEQLNNFSRNNSFPMFSPLNYNIDMPLILSIKDLDTSECIVIIEVEPRHAL